YTIMVAALQSTLLCIPLVFLFLLYSRFRHPAYYICLHLFVLSLIGLLLANYKLHAMYNFFIGGFVINLLTTPGGIEALGLSGSFYRSATIGGLIVIGLYLISIRYLPFERLLPRTVKKLPILVGVALLFLSEVIFFSYSAFTANTEVLSVASRVVWHIPVTARGFYISRGLKSVDSQNIVSAGSSYSGKLDYPVSGSNGKTITQPYNIIWLTAESLRHDMVTERIMPSTYEFASNNSWFASHYSGGNGTRLGMFSQFYGIYGSYWFDFLNTRQTPLLLDVLQQKNYTMKAFTSARFTYPEFDKTIFAGFQPKQLIENREGPGWLRDTRNTDDLISYIKDSKSKGRPFFGFMFFESAHANYYFPDSSILEPDYLDDFDYLSVDIAKNITKIKNRYINSSHYLDTRLALIFDTLKEQDLYDNTIVIVTGDHGEEFMEKGRWGHNSTFVQEQIRVPMLVHIPGQRAEKYTNMTSHLDMPATLFAALGYDIEPSAHSFGQDLFADDYVRDYTVASDWHGDALITPNIKFVLTLKGAMNAMQTSTLDDEAVSGSDISSGDRAHLKSFIVELSRFYSGSPEHDKVATLIESRKNAPVESPTLANTD
ncbi:MAG: membrane-anchored protein YejM (alkaline phosphatase superfamily), partial [Halieaceae bacterium]